ncbi:hypothetical protein BD779DRAFT_1608834 [Infundibulicybe gibba]|nr:hypothetical protein BD779DRAFT_1608834 [Infundibulicybe gibba]
MARTDNTPPHKTQEKDKNRRLSCKECGKPPFTSAKSCVKRGCGSLCPKTSPPGALTSGRGSRFILANTEQLHEKILQLSDRVRQLEDALSVLQSASSNQIHPLLSPDLLRIKNSQDLYSAAPSIPPSDPQPSTQKDDHLRQSVSALSLYQNSSAENSTHVEIQPSNQSNTQEPEPPEVPPDILQLSATFPFPWSVDLKIRKRIRDSLPPIAEAQATCEEASRNALWQYNLDASETFLQNLLHHCYTTSIEDLSPRRLALLLMILSIGSYLAFVCESRANISTMLNFFSTDRDGSRVKVIPEEHEKRRAVFWELLNLDSRMSLSLGRPPSLCLSHVDTKPPSYLGAGLYVSKEEIIYHEWKNSFLINCLTPILETMVATDTPEYSRIIYLDNVVRDFATPPLLDDHSGVGVNQRFLVMQRALVSIGRDIALLQLHRRCFTEAMSEPDQFDLQHKFAPSVLATYLGASSLISAVETLFNQEPQLSARFLHFWFNAFSGAVTLSLLVSRAPSSLIAPFAVQDLERACQLFRKVAKILPFSGKAFPVLDKLAGKSRRIYLHWRNNRAHDTDVTMSSGQQILSPSFTGVHHALTRYAEQICDTATTQDVAPASSNPHSPQSHLVPPIHVSDAWLPDIYRFNSAGVGIDERYSFASARPTPFIPSSPRIDENETFNFDHGALTADLAETSYMAWF